MKQLNGTRKNLKYLIQNDKKHISLMPKHADAQLKNKFP